MAKNNVKPKNLGERLAGKFRYQLDSGCWEWTASRNRHGYGRIIVARRVELAHRVAFKFFNGIDPGEFCVCHKCDNPCCINPSHLFLGTHLDNMRDCNAKGRQRSPIGEENKASKLNPDLVRMILSSEKTNIELARELGVSNVAVRCVRRRETWKWVETEAGTLGSFA